MSVYNYSGNELNACYDKNGTSKNTCYDFDGNEHTFIDKYLTGRTIVWEDNFNTFDTSSWGYEIGNDRNNELQCYRAENVSVENGLCVLSAKRETYGGKEWTSGSITTMSKKSFTYGRIEAKLKFPSANGEFGAFWMLGENMPFNYVDGATGEKWTVSGQRWPKCGEVDIVEMFGVCNVASANLWNYDGTSFGGGTSAIIDITQWHKYSVEWTSEYIAMSVDDTEYKRYSFADYEARLVQAYLLPMNIKLNLAVGSSAGNPSAETNEMKMYIDWVRVYDPLTV